MKSVAMFLCLCAGLLGAESAFAQAASLKFAYVDMQRAMTQVEEGKRAKTSLEKYYTDKQAEIGKKEAAVKAAQESLDADSAMLSPDALSKRQQDLQALGMEYQQLVMGAQQEMQTMESNLTQKIIEKLSVTATKIAQAQSIDVLMEASSMVYAKPSLDITQQVIDAYNKEHK